MSDTTEHDVKCTKFACIALAASFFILVSGISSCQITKEVYKSDVIDAKTELARTQMELETGQNKALKELIDDGMNPIAARCAIIGWMGPEQTTLCAFFVKDDNRSRD